MKKSTLALASILSLGATAALASETFTDRARVIAVHPIVERIPVSREQCWNDRQRGYEERRVTRSDTGAAIGPGTVLGAIVGGVVGHQIGSGRGNDAATAAGAVVGGLVGNQIDRDNGPGSRTEIERRPVERTVERCRIVNEVREARVGYDVRYEYGGREFTTRMDRDPGRRLRVNVSLVPVEGNELPPDRPRPRPRPPTYR